MQLVGQESIQHWHPDVPPRSPSETLEEILRRLESFDLLLSEPAKTLLIDALLLEIVPLHPTLKVWKEAPLTTDTTTGVADYLIAPKRAYLAAPMLCVAEAKRDDFVRGQIQCIAEMAACRWHNNQRKLDINVYGIVSNGQIWQFYKLTLQSEVLETSLYVISDLPPLLGVLDHICTQCAQNISVHSHTL